ncbi:hypothetical protein [Amycolatopsis suaedae]|uniref:WXG100 family type VII secretion target n=1 Tax=Amycolatopsis suaedae TaxID=2510978 RepID=A0A4Q7J375_9PSEU|nr:hypothetical protein [Amycolatopsis suaedae]RZQ61941.1 hypothetical protein EWH70_20220 [Amycolatopsis suaedae]
MGFKVDPEALDRCSKLLDRYGDHAREVGSFLSTETSMDAHEEGVLSILFSAHGNAIRGMNERTDLMRDIGTDSARTMSSVAEDYRFRDGEGAAELDAILEGGSPKPLTNDSASVSDGTRNFEDRADPVSALEVGKGYQPGGFDNEACDWIDKKARELTDAVSLAYYARLWVKELMDGYFGWKGDPIDWVIELFAGEWKEWGKCASALEACGEAVERMATNVKYVPEGLAHTWAGNAADAALEYFQKLHSATKTESEAFTALAEFYKWQTEGIYDTQQMLNDLINFLLDIVADLILAAGIGLVTGGIGLAAAAPLLAKIMVVVSAIASGVTTTLNTARMFEHAVKFFDLPDMPDCELDNLNKKGEDPAYQKPERRS